MKGKAGQVHQSSTYAHWMAENIAATTTKVVNGLATADEAVEDLLITEAVFAGTQVIVAAAVTSFMVYKSDKVLASVNDSYTALTAAGVVFTPDEKEAITLETNPDKAREALQDFLNGQATALTATKTQQEDVRDQAQLALHQAQQALGNAQTANLAAQNYLGAQQTALTGMEQVAAAAKTRFENLEAEMNAHLAAAEVAHTDFSVATTQFGTVWPDYVAKSAEVDQLNKELKNAPPGTDVSDLQQKIQQAEAQKQALKAQADGFREQKDQAAAAYQAEIVAFEAKKPAFEAAQAAVGEAEAQATAQRTALDNAAETAQVRQTELLRFQTAEADRQLELTAAQTALDEMQNRLNVLNQVTQDTNGLTNIGTLEKYGGVADAASTIARLSTGLAALDAQGTLTEEGAIETGLWIGSEALGGLSAVSKEKAAAALGALGAVAGLASAGVGVGTIAQQLNDPNLTDEQRFNLELELGLQSSVMILSGFEGAMVAYLSTGAQYGATNLMKAMPMLSAVGAIAGAINPAKWNEFDAKQDRIDALEPGDDDTDDFLSQVLEKSLLQEKMTYGGATAVDMATGIATAGLAATGVGLPIAVLVGIGGGLISGIVQATEQNRLEDIADDIAEKMREAGGGSIENFFEGSFEDQQDALRESYEEYFDDILEGDFDAAVGLGSQTLTANDLALAAITKTADELSKTAKHYADTYTTDGGWDEEEIELTERAGSDIMTLGDRGDEKVYLTFMSPLMASGTESHDRKKTGKNSYTTSLKITDLAGWTIVDSGQNQTTFNMNKVINSAYDVDGTKKDLAFDIEAGGGDDVYFGYDSSITFDGGDGTDIASYTRMDEEILAKGVIATANGDKITVVKHLNEDAEVYQEFKGSYRETYGKRTETIHYRAVRLEAIGEEIDVVDTLLSVEVLHGTGLADILDMTGSTVVEQIMGFGGDDVITMGEATKAVFAGDGDDTIRPGEAMAQLLHAMTTLDEATMTSNPGLFISGGDGRDVVEFAADVVEHLQAQFAALMEARDVANFIGEALSFGGDSTEITSVFEAFLTSDVGQDFALATFIDVEHVHVDLSIFPGIGSIAEDDLNPAYALGVQSAGLTGISSGHDGLDATWFAADFNQIFAEILTSGFGLTYATRNTIVQSEAIPEGTAVVSGAVSQTLAPDTEYVFSGEIWIEADEVYEFRTDVDGSSTLKMDGIDLSLTQIDPASTQMTASFSTMFAGWHSFEFLATSDASDPSQASLAIRTSEMAEFEILDGETGISAELSAANLSSGVTLIGDMMAETLIGSDFSDTIFGHYGSDVIEGGKGTDALSGGDGFDQFIFHEDSGHDVIMEAFASDWSGNVFHYSGELDDLTALQSGDDLIFLGDHNNSLTLADFYAVDPDFTGDKTQRVVDEDGDMFVFDQTLSAQDAKGYILETAPSYFTNYSIHKMIKNNQFLEDYVRSTPVYNWLEESFDRYLDVVDRNVALASSDRVQGAFDSLDVVDSIIDETYAQALLDDAIDALIIA